MILLPYAGYQRKDYDMDIDFAKVGAQIQLHRKEKNLSQEQLAKQIGVSKGHLGHVEAGSKNPSAEMLINIAAALEVSVDTLLADLDIPRQKKEELQELMDGCTSAEHDIITELVSFMRDLLRRYGI